MFFLPPSQNNSINCLKYNWIISNNQSFQLLNTIKCGWEFCFVSIFMIYTDERFVNRYEKGGKRPAEILRMNSKVTYWSRMKLLNFAIEFWWGLAEVINLINKKCKSSLKYYLKVNRNRKSFLSKPIFFQKGRSVFQTRPLTIHVWQNMK